jgi:hypothetical protein
VPHFRENPLHELQRLQIEIRCYGLCKKEQSLTVGLIIDHNDGMDWALIFARPTFNTFLRVGRFRFLVRPLVHLARTDLNAIAAARTGLLIEFGMHQTPLASGVQ